MRGEISQIFVGQPAMGVYSNKKSYLIFSSYWPVNQKYPRKDKIFPKIPINLKDFPQNVKISLKNYNFSHPTPWRIIVRIYRYTRMQPAGAL